MKVVSFNKAFKLGIPGRKDLKVERGNKYIFSDFVIKTFIENITKKKGAEDVKDMIRSVDDLVSYIPVIDMGADIEELKKLKALVIVRTGGIGDLLALSNVVNLVRHIFVDVLGIRGFKVFFITDQRYGSVFKYFDNLVRPIYYFHDPIDKVLRNSGIYGTQGVRSIFFEGLIEEKEDNWFDLQVDRMKLKDFKLYDQIDKEYLVKNPKLTLKEQSIFTAENQLKKMSCKGLLDRFKYQDSNDTKTILLHHRASAWIRTFNLGDVIETLYDYFKSKGFNNYTLVTLPRNFSKSDADFINDCTNQDLLDHVSQITTSQLHEFFYIISSVDYVVSSDTAAFHFREGIKEGGLGLYSSFPCRMRTKTYKYTSSYDILFNDCKFVCQRDNYMGCVSHFKTPYEVCVYMAEKYNQYLTSDHHFKRGNRIPDSTFVEELEGFVKGVGMETLMDEGIFQYAPCLSSRWNPRFKEQLLKIYEREKLFESLSNGS